MPESRFSPPAGLQKRRFLKNFCSVQARFGNPGNAEPFSAGTFPGTDSPLNFHKAGKLFLIAFLIGLFTAESAFAVPPVPDWLTGRVAMRNLNTNGEKPIPEDMLYHEPLCPPHLCQKKTFKAISILDEGRFRKTNYGIQEITRANYRLRREVRLRWMRGNVEGKATGG